MEVGYVEAELGDGCRRPSGWVWGRMYFSFGEGSASCAALRQFLPVVHGTTQGSASLPAALSSGLWRRLPAPPACRRPGRQGVCHRARALRGAQAAEAGQGRRPVFVAAGVPGGLRGQQRSGQPQIGALPCFCSTMALPPALAFSHRCLVGLIATRAACETACSYMPHRQPLPVTQKSSALLHNCVPSSSTA